MQVCELHSRHFSGADISTATRIVFQVTGSANFESEELAIGLDAGTILIASPNLEWTWSPSGCSQTVILCLNQIYLEHQLLWLPRAHPLVYHLHRAMREDQVVGAIRIPARAAHHLAVLFRQLLQHHEDKCFDFTSLSLLASAFEVVDRMSGTAHGSPVRPTSPPRAEVLSAISLVRADPGYPWTMDDLAEKVHLSHSQLTRLFRASTGMSPMAFVRRIRAERMAELLASTSVSVREAGAAVGWSDASIASRIFKRRYGVPPRTFAISFGSPPASEIPTTLSTRSMMSI